MATDFVDKVTKLIALSGSNNKEEARTAAYLACKLIRENSLRVSNSGGYTAPSYVAPPPSPPPQQSYVRWDSVWYQLEEELATRKRINSNYAATCRRCGSHIAKYVECWWRRGGGVWCLICVEEAEAELEEMSPD